MQRPLHYGIQTMKKDLRPRLATALPSSKVLPPPTPQRNPTGAHNSGSLLAHQLLHFPIFFLLELLNEAFKNRHLKLDILGHLQRKQKSLWAVLQPPRRIPGFSGIALMSGTKPWDIYSSLIQDFLKSRSHAASPPSSQGGEGENNRRTC